MFSGQWGTAVEYITFCKCVQQFDGLKQTMLPKWCLSYLDANSGCIFLFMFKSSKVFGTTNRKRLQNGYTLKALKLYPVDLHCTYFVTSFQNSKW